MSEERKNRGWPWIVALLIGLPVLYFASFGPAFWIATRFEAVEEFVRTIYQPVASASSYFPDSTGNAIESYANWGAAVRTVVLLKSHRFKRYWEFERF